MQATAKRDGGAGDKSRQSACLHASTEVGQYLMHDCRCDKQIVDYIGKDRHGKYFDE